jgi:hypothetical protein
VRTCVRHLGLRVPVVVTALLLPASLDAQATGTDHTVVIELGGAAEWPLQGEQSNYGGTLAAEATPIEHWLEVEAGATLLGTSRRREIAADFIVKKPFEISSTVELMAGVGPELSWQLTRGSSARSLATECALDLMVWPTKNVGWYVEPTYNFTSFRAASGRSLALATGLIIGLPWVR